MIALTFDIHAREPLLITRLEGDPNSSISYPYVPGSVIRGALANLYLPDADFDLAGDLTSRHLFFDGSTRYLNAYPLDRRGARTLPVPLSWFREKDTELVDGAPIYDLGVGVADYLDQPKGLGQLFCQLDGQEVEFTKPEEQINVHTARERVKGRATEKEGAVFRYQAIAAGERFGGVILVSRQEDIGTLKGLLNGGDLWLGGSRSGGYGRARIENVQEAPNWTETGTPSVGLEPGENLVITLLSDAILRSQDGAHADDLTAEQLSAPLKGALRRQAAFKRVVPVGGFNRKWGLPLCQVPAIEAGSVFVFEGTSPIAAADLRRLEGEGIGERRAEGLGRLAVNWQREEVLTIRRIEPEPAHPAKVSLGGDSKALVQRMVERLLRQELDRQLAQRLGGIKCEHPPTNAQLSRLRAIALNALPSGDVDRLREFLSDDKLKARAREQYQEARIEGRRLLDWLRERVEEPRTIWRYLSQAEVPLPQIGDVRAELTDDLAKEYTIRLIEGLLHRAAKERGHD